MLPHPVHEMAKKVMFGSPPDASGVDAPQMRIQSAPHFFHTTIGRDDLVIFELRKHRHQGFPSPHQRRAERTNPPVVAK